MKNHLHSDHPHRRLNILTGEWILVSPHRTKRPWQGKEETIPVEERPSYDPACYLCPGNRRADGNHNPGYTTPFVFTNDFSALLPGTPAGNYDMEGLLVAENEKGICRVISYSPDHSLTLPLLSLEDIKKLVSIWKEEYKALASDPSIRYIQIFENKGEIMGCSNPHPHGQIWASSSLPAEIMKETYSQQTYFREKGRSLLGDYLRLELEQKDRIVVENLHFVAVVPFWAIWPYETMIISKRHVGSMLDFTPAEEEALAGILKLLTTKYDNLFGISMPYSAGMHQAPVNNGAHPEWHWHMHFYPPLLRSATVKKFMVGYEMLATPQRDITAESAADRLRSLPSIHYKSKNSMTVSKSLPAIIIFLVSLLLSFGTSVAQSKEIVIETSSNALVLQKGEKDRLSTLYFGKKLASAEEYGKVQEQYRQGTDYSGVLASVYTSAGSTNLLEPSISVTHADGNNSLDLRYVSHSTTSIADNVSLLRVELKDPVYDFRVTLCYQSYFKEDVIEQWCIIRHQEKSSVTLQKFASANLYLKAGAYWLTQYHGDWAKEMQPEVSRITHGIKTLDSKLGTRANLFQPSVFMVSLDRPATEDEGTVLFGALEYSGNFRTDLELDYLNNLKIISGMNNYASAYQLKPGESFVTPAFLYLLSGKGKGEASRKMHRWARNYKLAAGKGDRYTLLNNWESTYFDFNETRLSALLKDTKKLGVDLFLLDDGWFGNKYPRNDDKAGLGDWQENRSKLPDGIASLVKEAGETGVRFGIWIEPEMVNPKSVLYEQHRDWVIKQPAREEHYFRNQLVLDLSNPKVQDFVFGVVDNLLTKNPSLAYIKWDCNAVIYNAYSSYLQNQSHFYIEYMRGLNKVLEKVRTKYPQLPMMLCSGGGGRVDYAALQYFTEYWPSDNTDPLERIFMQWEYSYFYPAISSSNHVTDWGKQPLKFRTDVAMMGKPGFDIVVSSLPANDLQFCKEAISTFNSMKDVIWHGDQYRLADPRSGSIASIMYINDRRTEGIIFNYLVNNRYDEGSKLPILLKGLDPAKKYRIEEVNLYPGTSSSLNATAMYTGDFLMKIGFNPDVRAARTSVVLKISEVRVLGSE